MPDQQSLQSPSKKELCEQRTTLIQEKQQKEEKERDSEKSLQNLKTKSAFNES